MLGSIFDILYVLLLEMIPKDNLDYMPKDQALQELKKRYSQDFGYDYISWMKWGIDNNETLIFDEYDLHKVIVWEWKKKHDPENVTDNPFE